MVPLIGSPTLTPADLARSFAGEGAVEQHLAVALDLEGMFSVSLGDGTPRYLETSGGCS